MKSFADGASSWASGSASRSTQDSEVVPGLADFMAEVVYGGIWDRPQLPVADRLICTLAALGLLQRLAPLERMVGTALDHGLPPRSILEVFMQAGLYGGFDTTESAAACAQRGVQGARLHGARGPAANRQPTRCSMRAAAS